MVQYKIMSKDYLVTKFQLDYCNDRLITFVWRSVVKPRKVMFKWKYHWAFLLSFFLVSRFSHFVTWTVWQQNNLIFSVIMINLGYNQKLSWKYCNYYHPPYIKISISYQKYAHLVQKFCSFSHLLFLSPNFLNLWSIYFCIISIFLRGSGGVSHSYTVSLIEGLSKINCPIYQEENSALPQKCSWNYSLVIKIHLKFIMLIKTSAIQSGL